MFQVGNKVVYPNHGVGLIESINEFVVGGEATQFYTVHIVSSKSTVKVPAGNAAAVGLRDLVTKKEIDSVLAYLRGPDLTVYADWKERFKQNSDRMRTGKMLDTAVVLKSLHFVAREKPLSYREKRMYERAMFLVASEIAEVRRRTTTKVEESLLKALNSAKI